MSAPALPSPSYHPVTVPPSECDPGERDRAINYPVYAEWTHYPATVNGFEAGGFEATVRIDDIQLMTDAGCVRQVVQNGGQG